MAELFPEDEGVARAQVRWLLAQGDAAGAEAALRARVARGPGDTAPALTVVQFLYEREGAEAAAAETEAPQAAAVPDGPGEPLVYESIAALEDCGELQAAFDTAADNNDREDPGSDRFEVTLSYMDYADERLRELGCYE